MIRKAFWASLKSLVVDANTLSILSAIVNPCYKDTLMHQVDKSSPRAMKKVQDRMKIAPMQPREISSRTAVNAHISLDSLFLNSGLVWLHWSPQKAKAIPAVYRVVLIGFPCLLCMTSCSCLVRCGGFHLHFLKTPSGFNSSSQSATRAFSVCIFIPFGLLHCTAPKCGFQKHLRLLWHCRRWEEIYIYIWAVSFWEGKTTYP
jgi:hypothetical protein